MMRPLAIAGLVALAALSRLVPHPPNFVPITAVTVFGGVTRVTLVSRRPRRVGSRACRKNLSKIYSVKSAIGCKLSGTPKEGVGQWPHL